MLYREIIAVCSEIHAKHINTLCGQNVELLNYGTYSDHWAVKSYCLKVTHIVALLCYSSGVSTSRWAIILYCNIVADP